MSRTVKFLGVEFEVVSADEQAAAPEGSVYAMIRVVDADPTGGSPDLRRRRRKELCDDCRAVCWFDPKSYGSTPAHVDRLCLQCVMARSEKESGNKEV